MGWFGFSRKKSPAGNARMANILAKRGVKGV